MHCSLSNSRIGRPIELDGASLDPRFFEAVRELHGKNKVTVSAKQLLQNIDKLNRPASSTSIYKDSLNESREKHHIVRRAIEGQMGRRKIKIAPRYDSAEGLQIRVQDQCESTILSLHSC